jgi:hypothetical protein
LSQDHLPDDLGSAVDGSGRNRSAAAMTAVVVFPSGRACPVICLRVNAARLGGACSMVNKRMGV